MSAPNTSTRMKQIELTMGAMCLLRAEANLAAKSVLADGFKQEQSRKLLDPELLIYGIF